MSGRFMRVIVFFDLPTGTNANIREYNKFRKYLIKNGFVMEQYSIYSKLVLNGGAAESTKTNIKKNKPSDGLVAVMIITEKQYSNIDYIVGKPETDVIQSEERTIII